MKIAVASGKGGTGKTTIAVNLAAAFDQAVQLLDCDVEEPNVHLFLKRDNIAERIVTMPIPEVDETRCTGCGECGCFCEFNAIVSVGSKPLVFPEMCHGCGGCQKICPEQALRETPVRIGTTKTSTSRHITLTEGNLDVGLAMAPPVIKAVKAQVQNELPAILDAPPGTSCPVIAAIRDVDYVIMVTEPTPFGLHDLALAVDMVNTLGIPFGVVVNRAGSGDHRVHEFCHNRNISLILEIPDDRRIAEAYSRGELIVDALPEYKPLFARLKTGINTLVHGVHR